MTGRFLRRRFRPRLLRAFQDWYRKNRRRLAVTLHLIEHRRGTLRFRIGDVHESITVVLAGISLSVYVDWRGSCWDMLLSLDAVSERIPGSDGRGYRCAIYWSEGSDAAFITRAALWEDHLFEPFARWLSDTLVPATHLCIGGSREAGATWAYVMAPSMARKGSSVVEVPLRRLDPRVNRYSDHFI